MYVRRLVSVNNNNKIYSYESLSCMLKEYHVYILDCIQRDNIVPIEFDEWLNNIV